MKNKTWIALLGGMLVCLLAGAWLLSQKSSGTIANIYQDSVCIRSIDLEAVEDAYTFTVVDQSGHENVIAVEPGRIRVESANCPDQICVDNGWLSTGVTPIVCLPAKLVIRLENQENAFDGATR
jgi:hypothetical protein